MHPKRWSIICWLLLVLWLIPSVAHTIPIAPDPPPASDMPLFSGRAVAYDFESISKVGFPFVFLEVKTSSASPKPQSKYYLWAHLATIAILATNLVALVYCLQSLIPRFSIKLMLVGMTLVAILILIGQTLAAAEDYRVISVYTYSIIFAPLLALLPTILYNRFFKPSTAVTEN